jgi:hypothetical protein
LPKVIGYRFVIQTMLGFCHNIKISENFLDINCVSDIIRL